MTNDEQKTQRHVDDTCTQGRDPGAGTRRDGELAVLLPGAAFAREGFDGQRSGSATIIVDGDGGMADIELDWEGLAAEILDLSGKDYEALSGAPVPHAQHILAGGEGRCPSPDGDTDGDGIIDTPQGGLAYGGVVTSLTTGDADTGPGGTLDIEDFPTGDSASYSRSIDLSGEVADFVREGSAVIVVHGLEPAIMPGETALADSAISEDLPLAATAPVLCGVLPKDGDGMFTAQLSATNPVAQAAEGDAPVSETPSDGVAAGGASTADTGLPLGLLTLVAGLLALAATSVFIAAFVLVAEMNVDLLRAAGCTTRDGRADRHRAHWHQSHRGRLHRKRPPQHGAIPGSADTGDPDGVCPAHPRTLRPSASPCWPRRSAPRS